jgi:TP901 family phage tail tape measure protein
VTIFPIAAKVTANTGGFVTAMAAGSAGLKAFAGAAGLATGALGALAGAAAMGAAVKAATEYQAELVKLNTLVGLQTEEIEKYGAAMKDLAQETGKAPADLARAMFAITSGGARGAEAMAILEQAAKASAVGLGDMTEIGRVATAALQAFGDTGLTASKAIDVMLATVRAGNLEAEELAGSLGRVMGTAAALGIGFEDLGAFVATYTRLGVNARVATTGLNGALNMMLRPSKEARAKMEELGIPVEHLRATLAKDGLNAALMQMKAAIGDNVDSLATVIPNIRALGSILGTVGVQAEAYAQIQQEVNNSNGLVNKGFETWGDTAEATFSRFNASVKSLAISFGEVLLPPLELVINVLRPFVAVLGKLVDVTDDLFRAFARDVTAFFDNDARSESAQQALVDRLQTIQATYESQGLSLEGLKDKLAEVRAEQARYTEAAAESGTEAANYEQHVLKLGAEVRVLSKMVQEAERSQADLNAQTDAASIMTQGQIEAEEARLAAVDEIVTSLETELFVLKKGERALLNRELTTLSVTDTTRELTLEIYDEIVALEEERKALQEAERERERTEKNKQRMLRDERRDREREEESQRQATIRAAEALRDAKMAEQLREITDVSQDMAESISAGFEGIVSGSKSVADAFGDMVTDILKELQRLAIQKAITEPLFNAIFAGLGGNNNAPLTGAQVDAGVIDFGRQLNSKNIAHQSVSQWGVIIIP